MTDLLLDENGDIQFDANGELVIGEAEQQDVKLLLATRPGDWKEHPTTGIDALKFIKSREAKAALAREMNIQLSADGFLISNIDIDYPNIEVDATRIQ